MYRNRLEDGLSLPVDQIETLTFDSYSTIVDVDAAKHALEDVVDDPAAVADLWRQRSLEYSIVSNEFDAYQPFKRINEQALAYALDAVGADVSPAQRADVVAVYDELEVFPDVQEGLERLRDGGYELYVLSNGNPEMLESMVAHAEIGSLLTDTISADEISTFKPATELYQYTARKTGTPVDRTAHVSAAWFDVQGAMNAGMHGVWANRKDQPWEQFGAIPDETITTFFDLVEVLGV